MKGIRIGFCCGMLIICLLLILCTLPFLGARADQDYSVPGSDYELLDDSRYDYSSVSSTSSFFYGAKSLGKLHINGAIEKESKFNGYPAYGATGSISIQYTYDGTYKKSQRRILAYC